MKPCIWMILGRLLDRRVLTVAGVHLECSRKWRLHLEDYGVCLLDVAGVHLERSRKWRLHLDDSGGVF